jgi:acetyl-CoA carboxylase, biotin carboxylase subunit
LVEQQFRIAAGEPLGISQDDIRLRGWALECRIYAEDPERNFFPSPGVIRELIEPQGPGVRLDSGVYRGWNVPIHYDPLLAKLVTYGSDRRQAIARMQRALAEYRIEGIHTNLAFFSGVLSDPEFIAGRFSTNFIEDYLLRRHKPAPAVESVAAASLAAALAYAEAAASERLPATQLQPSAWKLAGRSGSSRSRTSWRF